MALFVLFAPTPLELNETSDSPEPCQTILGTGTDEAAPE